MPIILPWQSHVPDPAYIRALEGKRVMFDVGTLLRAILFRESHSARLLEHIERSLRALAVICPHVRNAALFALTSSRRADLVPQFSARLLACVQRKTISIIENGDPSTLPSDVAFDRGDDDIVIATAISGTCHYLATLDHKCAAHAGKVIDVLSPSQPDFNRFFPTTTTINVPLFAGGRQGSVIMEVQPSVGSTGYTGSKGRRYVLSMGNELGIWLSESSWRYQIGVPEIEEPIHQFREMPLDRHVLLAISYDCMDRRLIAGFQAQDGTAPETTQLKAHQLPMSFNGNFGILSRGEMDSFSGYWRGILSTQKFIGRKALRFGLEHKFHFADLDAQKHRISDAVFEPVVETAESWLTLAPSATP